MSAEKKRSIVGPLLKHGERSILMQVGAGLSRTAHKTKQKAVFSGAAVISMNVGSSRIGYLQSAQ